MWKIVTVVTLLTAAVMLCTAQSSLPPHHADLVADIREENAHRIPCPFLAGLYKRGFLNPDDTGRVSSDHVKEAIVNAGSTVPNAIFPAFGTVRFKKEDVHQTKRFWDYSLVPAGLLGDFFPGAPSGIGATRLYLNLLTMNVADKCMNGTDRALIPSRFPCNANPQHVQHGYSTTIRDPRYDAGDPTRTRRFDDWIGRVLVKNATLSTKERVMTFDGFTKLLARMAVEGDKSSEWSLKGSKMQYNGSNVEHYHPSVKPKNAEALNNWTAYLAWVGLWEAFGRLLPSGKGKYMTESDLRTLFLDGDMPRDWRPSEFTLKDVGYTIIALKGHGIPTGDLWSETIKKYFPLSNWLPQWGDEWRYMINYSNANRQLGFFLDNILNPYP